MKYYLKLGPVVQEEMSFKYISILALIAILFCGAKGLCNQAEQFVQSG